MKREEFISEYTRVNRKFEVKWFDPIKKAIQSKVDVVRDKLKSGGVHAAETFLHTNLGNVEMTKTIKGLYLQVGRRHAQMNYSRLLQDQRQKGFGFNQEWANFINYYLQTHLLDKVTFQIDETTRTALLKALEEMVNKGLTVDQMVDRLENWPFKEFQAARIARTEVNRAANTGAKAQADTSKYQQNKEWIAIHDNRTRGNPINGQRDHANHWTLDGMKIDEEDVFVDPRNGDRLDFPGDPSGSAASTINCRCAVAYTYKRDSQGNLIPKRRSTAVIFPSRRVQRQEITI